MFRSQLPAGHDAPDYSPTDSTRVTVDTPTADADLDVVRVVTTFEYGMARRLPLDEVRVPHALREGGRARLPDLEAVLRMHRSPIKAAATRLVERGLVEQVGERRAAPCVRPPSP